MRLNLQKSNNNREAVDGMLSVVRRGDLQRLCSMIDAGFDVNTTNSHGMTPLMVAASNGRLDMVRALLNSGADPNRMRNDKFTALALAAFFGHEEIVRQLVKHGAKDDGSTRFKTSPQMWARARTFEDVARYLNEHKNESRLSEIQTARPLDSSSVRLAASNTKTFAVTSSRPLYAAIRRRPIVLVPIVLVLIVGFVSSRFHRPKPIIHPTNQPQAANVDSTRSNVFETPVISSNKEQVKTSTDAALNLNHYKPSEPRQTYRPNVSRREATRDQDRNTPESSGNVTLQPKITPPPPEVTKSAADAQTLPPIKTATQKPPLPMTPLLITPRNPTNKSKVIQWP